MSRTDKDKPWLVRVAEHQPWADHDHSRGICDLPDSPLDNSYRDWCRWSDWKLQYSNCCRNCSCRMCTGYWFRREERRRSRHQAKQQLQYLAGGGEEFTRRSPAKKDTRRWCRGKVGRRHVLVARYANWAKWRIAKGQGCYNGPEDSWRPGWQCYHEIGCSTCGKILEPSCPPSMCPLNPAGIIPVVGR